MPAYLKRLAFVALVFAAIQPASAGEAQLPPMPDLVIGALARAADGGRWVVAGGDGRYTVACSGKDCDGHLIDIDVRPGAGGECSDTMLGERMLLAHPGAFGGGADRHGLPQLDRFAGARLHRHSRRPLPAQRQWRWLPRHAAPLPRAGSGVPGRPRAGEP
jgi:hypothetical protein